MSFGEINSEPANRVYDVLVDHCGASADSRGMFLDSVRFHGLSEYRFMGDLGFGGKVWFAEHPPRGAGHFWVSAYKENLTPERETAIERANQALLEVQP